ncbi:hypothetical protein M5K25_023576 [Dendrobium thyrsiflorum]|uniref:Uncharacterized protein n=1 Tax=Dendrobium thyrsiflorum TaxID=117978 RepID=A0ABD0U8P8_DENTH
MVVVGNLFSSLPRTPPSVRAASGAAILHGRRAPLVGALWVLSLGALTALSYRTGCIQSQRRVPFFRAILVMTMGICVKENDDERGWIWTKIGMLILVDHTRGGRPEYGGMVSSLGYRGVGCWFEVDGFRRSWDMGEDGDELGGHIQ